MKLSTIFLLSLVPIGLTLALASLPQSNDMFTLGPIVDQMLEERLFPDDKEDVYNMINKRSTTLTVEYLLNALNRSEIIFDVLDLIAYNPNRIAMVANTTSKLVGDVNLTAITLSTSKLKLDLNYTRIYNDVMDSGVVTSLLRGILLDTSYRPVLVNLINRLLEGNKNVFNYLVKNLFKKSKRDEMFDKRDYKGTLEDFVAGILSAVLNSDLVGGIALDTLVALNETQFLTYTVKRLIANEGYQNMTAQLVLDIANSGNVQINSNALNITSIVDKVLSRPMVIVSLVSNVLSGNFQIPSLGEYSTAVKEILADVENSGTFADLNQYVFSESHSVTMPLLPTGQIVVPRNNSYATTTKGSGSKSGSGGIFGLLYPKATSTSLVSSSLSSQSMSSLSGDQLNNLLGLLGGLPTSSTGSSQSRKSFNTKAASTTGKSVNSVKSNIATTTTTAGAFQTGNDGLTPKQSQEQINSILSVLRSSSFPTTLQTLTTTLASASSMNPNILNLLNILGQSSQGLQKRETSSNTTKGSSSNGGGIVHALSFGNLVLLLCAYLI